MKKFVKVLKIIICFFMSIILFINSVLIFKSIVNLDKVPDIMGYKSYIVMSDSIETEVEFGDFVIVDKSANLKQNDVVVVNSVNKVATTYRIKDIKNQMLKLENDSSDFVNLSRNSIEGKVIFKIGFFGEIFLLLQNPIVIFFVGVLTILLGICIYKLKLFE